MDTRRLAFAIRHFRLTQDLSIAELSRKTGVSISYISNIERARHPRPGLNRVEAVAQGLGFTSYQDMLEAAPAGQIVPKVDFSEAIAGSIAASIDPGVSHSDVSDEGYRELRNVLREIVVEVLVERGLIEPPKQSPPPRE